MQEIHVDIWLTLQLTSLLVLLIEATRCFKPFLQFCHVTPDLLSTLLGCSGRDTAHQISWTVKHQHVTIKQYESMCRAVNLILLLDMSVQDTY